MYEQISENNRNTVLLVAFFSVFVLALAWILGEVWFAGGGTLGIIVGFLFLLVFVGINYFFADKIVLSISGAREVKKGEYPYLFNIIEGLAIAAGIPKPKAYVIEDTALNAFATGRNPEHGIVVVTTGILKTLDRQELEGVIAHEMSHIKNYDIRLMTLVVVFVGLSALLDIAKPGQRILMTSYGSGAGSDSFSWVVTDRIVERREKAPSVASYIAKKKYVDYGTYVRLRGKLKE